MKHKVWIVVILIIVVIGGVWGYTRYQDQQKEAQITTQLDNIQKDVKTFNEAQGDAQKLTVLKKMVTAADRYHQKDNQSSKVNQAYHVAITMGQGVFKNQNQQVLKANTLSKAVSAETVTSKNDRLQELLADVNQQWSTVYTTQGLKKMTQQIKTTIKANKEYVKQEEAVRETASSTSSETATKALPKQSQAMNYEAVKTGNYASLNGTWQNGEGRKIVIRDQTMQFSDILDHKGTATVIGQEIDIPGLDGQDGRPQDVPGLGGTTDKAYEQQLKSVEKDGVFTLWGTIPSAALTISFLPKGTMGDLTDGDVNQDKIISVGTQASATSVDAAAVYYKVN
ncbi:DUF6287 domain-containing protein [Latilactobacillus sakei]